MNEKRTSVSPGRLVVALAMLSFIQAAPPGATVREAWALNGQGRSIVIVDIGTESVTGSIPLDPVAADDPRGLAFSTLDGFGGDFAFVGQGGVLHRVDVAAGDVTASIDLSAVLGLPTSLVDLAAAQGRGFGPAPVTSKAYLYAAADVSVGGTVEPYYIVLDQEALIDPLAGPAVVEFGPLGPLSLPAGDRGRAAGVSVLGAPHGAAYQRVWYTTRSFPIADTIRSIPLVKGDQLGDPWIVGPARTTALAPGAIAPDVFSIAVPYDREYPVLPTGSEGRLVNLDTGRECDLGVDLRDVAIGGPGFGGYQLMALDGAMEQLLRVDPVTCDVEATPTGTDPVSLAIDGISEHGKVLVANRGSDTVTILRNDGTAVEVPLGVAPASPCVLCPGEIQVRRCCDGCTVAELSVDKTTGDDVLTWSRESCSGCSTGVYCQCAKPEDTTCSCYCGDNPPITVTPGPCFTALPGSQGGPDTESPWKQIGIEFDDDHTHANPTGDLKYAIVPVP